MTSCVIKPLPFSSGEVHDQRCKNEYDQIRRIHPVRDPEAHTSIINGRTLSNEMTCPICLDLLSHTMTAKDCLHRFCFDCINMALQKGNRECPTCRAKLKSKRDLRPDPNFDLLIKTIWPDRRIFDDMQNVVPAPTVSNIVTPEEKKKNQKREHQGNKRNRRGNKRRRMDDSDESEEENFDDASSYYNAMKTMPNSTDSNTIKVDDEDEIGDIEGFDSDDYDEEDEEKVNNIGIDAGKYEDTESDDDYLGLEVLDGSDESYHPGQEKSKKKKKKFCHFKLDCEILNRQSTSKETSPAGLGGKLEKYDDNLSTDSSSLSTNLTDETLPEDRDVVFDKIKNFFAYKAFRGDCLTLECTPLPEAVLSPEARLSEWLEKLPENMKIAEKPALIERENYIEETSFNSYDIPEEIEIELLPAKSLVERVVPKELLSPRYIRVGKNTTMKHLSMYLYQTAMKEAQSSSSTTNLDEFENFKKPNHFYVFTRNCDHHCYQLYLNETVATAALATSIGEHLTIFYDTHDVHLNTGNNFLEQIVPQRFRKAGAVKAK